MFESIRKKRAIRQYVKALPPALKKRYGGSGLFGYTEGQVRTTIEFLGLNKKFIEFAFLIFCGKAVLENTGYDSRTLTGMLSYIGGIGVASHGGDGYGSILSPYDFSGCGGGNFGGGDCGGHNDGGSDVN